MSKRKFKLDRKSLEIFYFTFFRHILEYGDVVWNNCSQYEKDELEKMQIQAARKAIGATKLIPVNVLHNETQSETLQQRRQNHQITFFYKMSNNPTNYLSTLIPQPVGAISRYDLRNSNDLQTLDAKSRMYYHSFLATAIRGWNSLSEEVKSCDFINSFRHQLKKEQNSPKLLLQW